MEIYVMLKALGDPTRWEIYQNLLQRKHCTRSLSKKTGITESAVSQHMKILKEAGLVYGEKYGRHMHYLPDQNALDELVKAFGDMSAASAVIDRDPGRCQCEFREEENK